jgi:murein L,D-transpeptidase YcbB/YkuD
VFGPGSPVARALLTICCLLAAATLPAQPLAPPGPAAAIEIERLLQSEPLRIGDFDVLAREYLLDAYRASGFQPLWTDRRDIQELLELVEAAREHGLEPEDYGTQKIRQILRRVDDTASVRTAAASDILLSESLFRYIYHRRFGKVKASSLYPDINYRREVFGGLSPAATLRQALEAPSLAEFIETLAPTGPFYRALQYWLRVYRDLEAAGGWPELPEGPTLHPDDVDQRVQALRERLRVTGEASDAAVRQPELFDEDLVRAVKIFQQRHALTVDGLVGRQTLEALNVSAERRVGQLRLSLERLRWVSQEASHTLVAVNIAGFKVFFVRDGERVWQTRAMVGRTYRQTPTFRGEMAYLELNPSWTLPPVILKNDTLPTLKRNPAYLAENRIRVFDSAGAEVDPSTIDWTRFSSLPPFVLRQDPGPHNALGAIKFIFPNRHSVFLHDTPHQALFEQADRAFSSGCIRIEDPLGLAVLLLDDPVRYSRRALESMISGGETRRIPVPGKVPVLILYLTASIDADGELLFYRDVYGRDAKALQSLDGPVVLDLPLSG